VFKYFWVSALCMITACASSGPPDVEPVLLAEPDTALQIQQSADLTIAPQDKLAISVFGVSELDGEYSVNQDGMIKIPLIGETEAVGHTENALAGILEKKLEESFLQQADVSVSIEESLARQLTVDGAVKNPGLYPVQGKMHLLQAVAVAGGPDDTANTKKVVVFREINGQRMAAAFDLSAIRRGEAEDPVVYGNDIVVVDGSAVRSQYGNILRTLSTLAVFLALGV